MTERKRKSGMRRTVTVRAPWGEVYTARVLKVSHYLTVNGFREPVFTVLTAEGEQRSARLSWLDERAQLKETGEES